VYSKLQCAQSAYFKLKPLWDFIDFGLIFPLQDYRCPIFYNSSIPLLLRQFYFPVTLRAALFHVLWQYILREDRQFPRLVSAPVVRINRATTHNLCHGWRTRRMVPRSVRSVLTMLANNQSHVNTIEFPSFVGFFDQGILSSVDASFFHFFLMLSLLRLVILASILCRTYSSAVCY
jgi:hypothetical protein